jgi:hypothetical protein
VVIVATGGLPQNPPLEAGDELATSSWDVLSGAVRPGAEVLVYDDGGGHAGDERGRGAGARRGAGSNWSAPSASSRPISAD